MKVSPLYEAKRTTTEVVTLCITMKSVMALSIVLMFTCFSSQYSLYRQDKAGPRYDMILNAHYSQPVMTEFVQYTSINSIDRLNRRSRGQIGVRHHTLNACFPDPVTVPNPADAITNCTGCHNREHYQPKYVQLTVTVDGFKKHKLGCYDLRHNVANERTDAPANVQIYGSAITRDTRYHGTKHDNKCILVTVLIVINEDSSNLPCIINCLLCKMECNVFVSTHECLCLFILFVQHTFIIFLRLNTTSRSADRTSYTTEWLLSPSVHWLDVGVSVGTPFNNRPRKHDQTGNHAKSRQRLNGARYDLMIPDIPVYCVSGEESTGTEMSIILGQYLSIVYPITPLSLCEHTETFHDVMEYNEMCSTIRRNAILCALNLAHHCTRLLTTVLSLLYQTRPLHDLRCLHTKDMNDLYSIEATTIINDAVYVMSIHLCDITLLLVHRRLIITEQCIRPTSRYILIELCVLNLYKLSYVLLFIYMSYMYRITEITPRCDVLGKLLCLSSHNTSPGETCTGPAPSNRIISQYTVLSCSEMPEGNFIENTVMSLRRDTARGWCCANSNMINQDATYLLVTQVNKRQHRELLCNFRPEYETIDGI